MIRLIPYLLIISFIFVSCNDHLKIEKNDDPPGFADSQFVGNWKVTGVSSSVPWDWDNNGTVESNIYATWSVCQKDNLFTFVGDKTGTFKLDCSITKDGSWQVINTEYLVYTPAGLGPESEKVVSMTSIQFTSTIDVTLPNGQAAVIIKVWSRQ